MNMTGSTSRSAGGRTALTIVRAATADSREFRPGRKAVKTVRGSRFERHPRLKVRAGLAKGVKEKSRCFLNRSCHAAILAAIGLIFAILFPGSSARAQDA